MEMLLEMHEPMHVRWAAATALGELRNALALNALAHALSDREGSLRWRAAEALGRLGDRRAVDALIAALDDQDDTVRSRAAEALGALGDARALEPLLKALVKTGWDEDSFRYEAARALGRLGDERAVAALITALTDRHKPVQFASAVALGKLGDARALEPLTKTLAGENWGDLREAAEALGTLGDSRATGPLTKALGSSEPEVRKAAAVSLAKLGQSQWAQWVRGEDGDWRRLGESGEPRALEPLVEALGNHRCCTATRTAAAQGLAKLRDARAIPLLIHVLGEHGRGAVSLRRAAAQSIFEMAKLNPAALADQWSAVRPTIMAAHSDAHEDRNTGASSDCAHVDHHSDAGIGLDFPEKLPDGSAGSEATDF
jgi:HEAT repeat protein